MYRPLIGNRNNAVAVHVSLHVHACYVLPANRSIHLKIVGTREGSDSISTIGCHDFKNLPLRHGRGKFTEISRINES